MTETKTIKELKTILNKKNIELNRAQLDIFRQAPVNHIDHFNIAIEQMAHSNINAFILLSEQKRHLAAMGIIRMHLDCLLKLFSTFIIFPRETWISSLLYTDEELWKKKISINNKKQPITDKFLCEQLELQGDFSNAQKIYNDSSKFIHPSKFHFSSALKEWIELPNKEIKWSTEINIMGIVELENELIKKNYILMLEITNNIIKYIKITKSPNNFKQYKLISL